MTTYDPLPLSDETQKIVNQPIANPKGLSDEDQQLVNLIASLVEDSKINLYSPSSLLNQEVCDKLTDEQKGKVDMQSFNMLSTIREIYNYHKSDFPDASYQFENMVTKFRLQKETTE